MTRNGEPIYLHRIKSSIHTGIKIQDFPGVIPEYYEREACIYAQHNWELTWDDLPRQQKAQHIAQYFLHQLIEQHAKDAEQQYMEIQSKRK